MGPNRFADDGLSPSTAEVTRGTRPFRRLVPHCTERKVFILIGLATALLSRLVLIGPSVFIAISSLYANSKSKDFAVIARRSPRGLVRLDENSSFWFLAQLFRTIQEGQRTLVQQGQRPPRCPANESDYNFILCKDGKTKLYPQFLPECEQLLNFMIYNNTQHHNNDIITLFVNERERRNCPLGETVVHPGEKRHLVDTLINAGFMNRYKSGIAALMAAPTSKPFVWMPELYNTNNPSVLVVHGGAYFDMATGRVQKCFGPGHMNTIFQFAHCGYFPPTPFVHDFSNMTIPRYSTAIFLSSKLNGFFHNMVEKLPQAVILHDVLAQQGNQTNVTLVLNNEQLVDPLRLLLGDAFNIDVTNHLVMYADTIIVPEPTHCVLLQPVMAQVTRALIDQRLSSTTTVDEQQPYILVVRRRRKRFIANHDELLAALTQAMPRENFVIYDEDSKPPPIATQWSIFAKAKMVVAPHGAALSNLLATAPGTVVVEFWARKGEMNLCFAILAVGLGLQYHPLSMELIVEGNGNIGSQYVVDVARVTTILVEIVERINQE